MLKLILLVRGRLCDLVKLNIISFIFDVNICYLIITFIQNKSKNNLRENVCRLQSLSFKRIKINFFFII